jgi:transposase
VQKPRVALDRGFYSEANLKELLALDCGFIIGAPWSVKQAKALHKNHAARLQSFRHAFLHLGVPMRHVQDVWHLGDTTLAAHLYFDAGRHAELSARFERTVLALEAKAGRATFASRRAALAWIRENAGAHASSLRVVPDGKGKARVATKPRQIAEATARFGYTLVLTHGREKSEETAENTLCDYRGRDTAEKLFDAFKTDNGQYRLRTASDAGVQGRFFLGFVALILRAELQKRMRASEFATSLTVGQVFDELAKIKALTNRAGSRILLEVTKKQRTLLEELKLPDVA